jgi:hypothetical protein
MYVLLQEKLSKRCEICATNMGVRYRFIQQSHSWSRLNITHDAFTTILNLFHIDLTFVDFVLGYGIRIRDDGLDLAGYARQISANPTNQALCYNGIAPVKLIGSHMANLGA